MSDAPRADLIDAPASHSFPKTREHLLSWERAEAQLDAARGARIVARWAEKYGRLMPRPSQGIFRFSAESARAWSTEKLQDGTRWHFQ